LIFNMRGHAGGGPRLDKRFIPNAVLIKTAGIADEGEKARCSVDPSSAALKTPSI
jgi:hypothetical protein